MPLTLSICITSSPPLALTPNAVTSVSVQSDGVVAETTLDITLVPGGAVSTSSPGVVEVGVGADYVVTLTTSEGCSGTCRSSPKAMESLPALPWK